MPPHGREPSPCRNKGGDREGTGHMVRDDTAPTLAVPMWVLKSW